METVIIKNNQGFAALKKQWEALIDVVPDASLFQCWHWQYSWWLAHKNLQELRLCCIYHQQQLFALLPAYLHEIKVLGVIRVKVLRLIGTGGVTSADYLGPVIHPDWQGAEKIIQHWLFGFTEWDQLELLDLRSEDGLGYCSEQKKVGRNCLTVHATLPYQALPSSFEQYLGLLSKKRRQHIRQLQRKISRLGNLEFVLVNSQIELEMAYSELVRLHALRWQGRTKKHGFSSVEYNDVHRAFMSQALDRGELKLFEMRLDGQSIGIIYCLAWRDVIYHFQGGFDPQYADLSPGIALLCHVIEYAIQEGFSEIDLLKGTHAYKSSLAKQVRRTYRQTVFAYSMTGQLAYFRRETLPNWHRRIKQFGARV